MAIYLITILKRTALGEVIRVEGETPALACEKAVGYGLSREVGCPIELLPWTCGIESLQDDNYQLLDIPPQFVDPAVRIGALEKVLRAFVDASQGNPLPPELVERAKQLLDSPSPTT